MVFKRKIYNQLLEWKNKWNGRRALLIEGARRIGKSTIAEEFAKNEYQSYIMIDFQKEREKASLLFKNGISDLDAFFRELSLSFGVRLYERNSLIIFDEVQFFPKARESIKQLVQDGRYDYLETGSLISLQRNVKDILIPSEERSIEMYPMDFEEFLWAKGDDVTIPLLKEQFMRMKPVGAAHNKILRDFRLYMAVGGMPQAVEELLKSNDFSMVDEVKRDILHLYKEDLRKIDDIEGLKTSVILDALPSELSSHNRLFKSSALGKNKRITREINSFETLNGTMIVNTAYGCTDPGISMALNKNMKKRKIYMGDTGLLVTEIFMNSNDPINNSIYTQLIMKKLGINLGMITENVIAQMLRANGYQLYFHTFGHYEVDFILARGKKISPVEVKSSSYKSHKSLDEFREKYSDKIDNTSYIIYGKDLKKEGNIVYLPFYMTMFL